MVDIEALIETEAKKVTQGRQAFRVMLASLLYAAVRGEARQSCLCYLGGALPDVHGMLFHIRESFDKLRRKCQPTVDRPEYGRFVVNIYPWILDYGKLTLDVNAESDTYGLYHAERPVVLNGLTAEMRRDALLWLREQLPDGADELTICPGLNLVATYAEWEHFLTP